MTFIRSSSQGCNFEPGVTLPVLEADPSNLGESIREAELFVSLDHFR